jgi:hypothetical protein
MAENQVNKSNLVAGIVLILIGIFFLAAQFGFVCWENLWPFILIIGGMLFFIGFLTNRSNFGLLMPGSILTITGLLFLYTNAGHWYAMENLWPTFIVAPGIGFVLMYLFGPKGNGLWIPALILIILALIFYAEFWRIFHFWPIILIVAGLYILVTAGRKSQKSDSKDPVDFTGS